MSNPSKGNLDLLAQLNAYVAPGTFAYLLGVRFVGATLDQIDAEVKAAEDQISRQSVIHGGALMAIADTLGGFATRITLCLARARRRSNRKPTSCGLPNPESC